MGTFKGCHFKLKNKKMSFIFIYQKGSSLKFLSMEECDKHGLQLKKAGWRHISTVSSSVFLARIYAECVGDAASDEKIKNIISLLTSR